MSHPSKDCLYTEIELCHAYHLVCVAEGDKSKIVFCTKYGSSEWLVILEGLTNMPATFQHFMNNIFSDMLDISVIMYPRQYSGLLQWQLS